MLGLYFVADKGALMSDIPTNLNYDARSPSDPAMPTEQPEPPKHIRFRGSAFWMYERAHLLRITNLMNKYKKCLDPDEVPECDTLEACMDGKETCKVLAEIEHIIQAGAIACSDPPQDISPPVVCPNCSAKNSLSVTGQAFVNTRLVIVDDCDGPLLAMEMEGEIANDGELLEIEIDHFNCDNCEVTIHEDAVIDLNGDWISS